ncbi:MAG: hypothetical protein ABIF82_03910 [Planctomycetota bacterium]
MMKNRRQHDFRKSVIEARARYALDKAWTGTIRMGGRAGRKVVKRLARSAN